MGTHREAAMAQEAKPFRDFNENVERAAEQSMKQAEGAMDNYFNWLQKAMSGSPWGATDFGKKVQNFTEQNIAATQEYVRKLSQVKTVQDATQIQIAFIQAQMTSFVDQFKELGEAYSKAVASAVKSPFDKTS
jgi:hypothetical protein